MSRKERAYEKYAWILLFLVGIIGIIAGLSDIVGGAVPIGSLEYESITGLRWSALVSSQPRVADFISTLTRITGLFLLSSSVLTLGISLKGFRSGQKWAWYVLWIQPLVLAAGVGFEFRVSGSEAVKGLFALALILSLLGLLLPVRKFFSRKQAQGRS